MKPLLFSCLISAFLATGCCNPVPTSSLAVTLKPQETDEWCWAASGQMCMNFLASKLNVTQCDEANKEFGRSDCCNCPTPNHSTCANPGWPQFDKYNFTSSTTANGMALTWDQVREQVYCKNKPFAFAWAWNGGGGHMMVAIGYVTNLGGTNYVVANNPWPPQATTCSGAGGGGALDYDTYDKFVGGPNYDHTHMADIYDITYKGGQ